MKTAIIVMAKGKARELRMYARLAPLLSAYAWPFKSRAMAEEWGYRMGFPAAGGGWIGVQWRPLAHGTHAICGDCGEAHEVWRWVTFPEFRALYGLDQAEEPRTQRHGEEEGAEEEPGALESKRSGSMKGKLAATAITIALWMGIMAAAARGAERSHGANESQAGKPAPLLIGNTAFKITAGKATVNMQDKTIVLSLEFSEAVPWEPAAPAAASPAVMRMQ